MARALLALAALVVLLVAGAAGWLLGTQGGLDWIVSRALVAAPALRIEGARGKVLGPIQVARAAWTPSVEVEALSGRISILNALTGTLRIDGLRAQAVRITVREDDGGAAPDLAPPLRVVLSDVEVALLRVERPGAAPLELSALHLNYAAGAGGHRLHNASASTPWGRVALDATMHAAPPYEIEATGTLERKEARIRARAVLHPLAAIKLKKLEAGAPDVDLRAIDPRLPQTRLDVLVRGEGIPDALLTGTFTATNKEAGPLDAGRLPARSLDARFVLRGEVLELTALEAGAGGGRLLGSARVHGTERVEASAKLEGIDLAAVRSTLRKTALAGSVSLDWTPQRLDARGLLEEKGMRVAGEVTRSEASLKATLGFTGIDPARIGAYPAGSLNGSAIVSGRLESPRRLDARWSIDHSRLRGEAFASRGRGRLEGTRVRDLDAALQWAQNRLTASGSFGAAGDRLAWTLVAPAPPVEGFAGRIEAHGTATGTLESPRLSFEARASPAELAGRIRLRELVVKGEGALGAHRLEASAQGIDYRLHASAEGGWRDGAWRGRVLSLSNRGRYPADLLEPVSLSASTERIEAGKVRASLGDGRVALERLAWSPGRIESAGSFTGLPAAWLAGAAGLGERLRATLLLDGEWAVVSSPVLDGSLRVRRAAGDLTLLEPTPLELGLGAAQLEATFAAGRIDARLSAESKYGVVSARARAGGIEGASPIEAQAELKLADVRVLAPALPPEVRLGGRATVHASARGTLGAPEFAGRLEGEALSVHMPPYGLYLEDGVLQASLAGDAVRLDSLRFRGGQGSLVATGTLPLTPQAKAAIEWRAERLQLLGRPDMRLVVSGDGTAALHERRLALAGRVKVDSGYFERGLDPLPELGDDVVVAGRPAPGKPGLGTIPLDLALHVDLGPSLKVREAGFDGLLRGEVDLATDQAGMLQAHGAIRASDATYRAYGRTLAVDPGVVTFDGPLRNPALQIEAWRRNQEVPAGVRITGSLQQPRVELVSDPPLPEGAKLSWLVLGRAPTETTGADLAVLQTAASAMLGRGDSVPITTRIADAVGLDELAVRGSSQVESRVVAVGKRLSDRLYLTYEAGVGAATQNLVKIDLSLTQRISLRAQTGSTSGAGVYYRYSWD